MKFTVACQDCDLSQHYEHIPKCLIEDALGGMIEIAFNFAAFHAGHTIMMKIGDNVLFPNSIELNQYWERVE